MFARGFRLALQDKHVREIVARLRQPRLDTEDALEAGERCVEALFFLQGDTEVDHGVEVLRRLREHALEPLARLRGGVLAKTNYAEVVHRVRMRGVHAQRGLELAARGCHIAGGGQRLPQIQVDIGIVRIELERAFKLRNRVGVASLVEYGRSQAHEYGGRGMGQRGGGGERVFSVAEFAQHQVSEAEVFERGAMTRLHGERLGERQYRFARACAHQERDTEQAQRVGIVWSARQHLLTQPLRAGGIARLQAFANLAQLAYEDGRHGLNIIGVRQLCRFCAGRSAP